MNTAIENRRISGGFRSLYFVPRRTESSVLSRGSLLYLGVRLCRHILFLLRLFAPEHTLFGERAVQRERTACVEKSVGIEIVLELLVDVELRRADRLLDERCEELAYAVMVRERRAGFGYGVENAVMVFLERFQIRRLDDEDEVQIRACLLYTSDAADD